MPLIVAGTGINPQAHLTVAAQQAMAQADHLFFLLQDAALDAWLLAHYPQAENLAALYRPQQKRVDSYRDMVACILTAVRREQQVCALFYGHPGLFVYPAHKAVWQARQEGYTAVMLPGIAADACFFADLGIDPAQQGCQSYDATDFLLRPRRFDTQTGLMLWQIGAAGNFDPVVTGETPPGLALLLARLLDHYPNDHQVYLYEAAVWSGDAPNVNIISLDQLATAPINSITTLYIPPRRKPAVNQAILQQLGLASDLVETS